MVFATTGLFAPKSSAYMIRVRAAIVAHSKDKKNYVIAKLH